MPQKPAERRYWLFKSDASFTWSDLLALPKKRAAWDGVRNYQARNSLRDDVRIGDGVLFYHSSIDEPAIAGVCRVVKAGYPDPKDATWCLVDVQAVRAIDPPLTRAALAAEKSLAKMELLRRGSRLSIQPVTPAEWARVLALAGMRGDPLA